MKLKFVKTGHEYVNIDYVIFVRTDSDGKVSLGVLGSSREDHDYTVRYLTDERFPTAEALVAVLNQQ